MTKEISVPPAGGVAHDMPADLREALTASEAAVKKWEGLTPLARNEWICWNISVKQPKTRQDHIKRTVTELQEGKRRPCCWIGCIHRTDKKISPSIQGILDKQAKNRRGK
ncbi:MAG: YdeI/OmpD-associated family protein [Patescibacteria group bacterium]